MPFGLSGSPASFQRLMDRILQGSQEYSDAYIDDVIFSENWEEHLRYLTDRQIEKLKILISSEAV